MHSFTWQGPHGAPMLGSHLWGVPLPAKISEQTLISTAGDASHIGTEVGDVITGRPVLRDDKNTTQRQCLPSHLMILVQLYYILEDTDQCLYVPDAPNQPLPLREALAQGTCCSLLLQSPRVTLRHSPPSQCGGREPAWSSVWLFQPG